MRQSLSPPGTRRVPEGILAERTSGSDHTVDLWTWVTEGEGGVVTEFAMRASTPIRRSGPGRWSSAAGVLQLEVLCARRARGAGQPRVC